MKKYTDSLLHNRFSALTCFSALLLFCLCSFSGYAQKKELVAYYPEWGVDHQHYFVRDIEKAGSGKYITTLIYSFVEPGPDASGAIVPRFMSRYLDYQQVYSAEMSVDGVADDSLQPLRGEFNQLRKLKAKYPGMKILLSIGGWTGSVYYSDLAATPESREKFITECIQLFIRGNLPTENSAGGKAVGKGIFDGFDIDWEFPLDGGVDGIHHLKTDRENLSALLLRFRQKLNEIDPHLLLTMAVPARTTDMYKYNFYKDQEQLDWYNLMTYDFHGSWDSKTGHHTNLFVPDTNRMSPDESSLDKTVRYLRDSLHVSSSKLVPGVAFYGKGWKHVSPQNHGLNQGGSAADGRFEPSSNNYCDLLPLLNGKAEYHHDDLAMAPWLYDPKDSVFWSFDDARSVALKSRYAEAYNLRGIMTWEISGDDPSGTLIKTMAGKNMPDIKLVKRGRTLKSSELAIQQPVQGGVYAAHSDIILTAKCKSDDITRIEFFGDSKSLGYITKFPASWVWFNVPSGTHTIKIIATDKHGNRVLPEQGSVTIMVR